MNEMNFTFADTIAGYVTTTDWNNNAFGLKTTDGREYVVKLTDVTYGQVIRNPGEAFQNPGNALQNTITTDQYLFAYGIFYPENGSHTFEAKVITFVGRLGSEYRFEAPDWWIRQIRSLAEFYMNAQFPDGNIDFHNYRTQVTLEGQTIPSSRQETDTMSRMVYGFATAYMLTGDDRYLDAAERGTEYLREHMRAIDEEKDVVYWYNAVEFRGTAERKIYASQVGDDYAAIPAYEQIYALAGPIQTYRVTGDPQIFYNAFFPETDNGGVYFNVLASGTPYLVGTERLKGSHSMSGYHSFELCYLATV